MSRVILAKPISSPRVVADGVDNDVRPKAGAVLTNAPAFFFKPSLLFELRQAPVAARRCAVFVGVEPREVLPDNLVWCISLDALRARIPVGDVPSRSSI